METFEVSLINIIENHLRDVSSKQLETNKSKTFEELLEENTEDFLEKLNLRLGH